ncbi:MAG: hypothetical protein WCE51_13585 [Chthoniobacterales bacterium]
MKRSSHIFRREAPTLFPTAGPAVTLRKDVERLRNRYGQILRDEVRGTVTDPAEVDDELRYLCRTVGSM